MTCLILTSGQNNTTFRVAQSDLSQTAHVSDFSVINASGGTCFNPVDPPLIFVHIPELSDYRTSLFLSSGANIGSILGTAYLRAPGIYTTSLINIPVVTGNIFNRELTISLLGGDGLPLVFNANTIYSVKINLK